VVVVCAPRAAGYKAIVEHDEQADRLEREADKLEQESERVGAEIEGARREWEQKQEDSSVPGAQPAEDEGDDEPRGPKEDDGT
jgi:hypothetical protein